MSKKGEKLARELFRSGIRPEKKMDRTPVEMPLGYCEPTPIQEIIARMVREAVAIERGEEFETMDEADDFDMPDEDDGLLDMSPYELTEIQSEAEFGELDQPARTPPRS